MSYVMLETSTKVEGTVGVGVVGGNVALGNVMGRWILSGNIAEVCEGLKHSSRMNVNVRHGGGLTGSGDLQSVACLQKAECESRRYFVMNE